jgi:hypothetical protein
MMRLMPLPCTAEGVCSHCGQRAGNSCVPLPKIYAMAASGCYGCTPAVLSCCCCCCCCCRSVTFPWVLFLAFAVYSLLQRQVRHDRRPYVGDVCCCAYPCCVGLSLPFAVLSLPLGSNSNGAAAASVAATAVDTTLCFLPLLLLLFAGCQWHLRKLNSSGYTPQFVAGSKQHRAQLQKRDSDMGSHPHYRVVSLSGSSSRGSNSTSSESC